MTDWFYIIDEQSQGPIPEQQLRDLFSQGRLGPDTLLWAEGMAQWQKASETALFAPPPQPVAAAQPASPAPLYSPANPAAGSSPSPSRADTGFSQSGIAQTGEGLRIAETFRQSFSILRSRIGFWLLTSLIATLVTVPIAMISEKASMLNALAILVPALLNAILTYAAFQACCGRDFTLGDAFLKGADRFLPVLGIMALVFLAAALATALVFAVLFTVSLVLGDNRLITPLLSVVFVVLLVMAMVRIFVCVAVCVAEKAGPIVSIRRSLFLTDGSSWKIFGVALIPTLTAILFLFICAAIIGVTMVATGHKSIPDVWHYVLVILFAPLQWLFTAFMVILTTTTYVALRQSREGFTTSDFAKIFD